jgi:6-phospho-3-hexuloisomerase
MKEEIKQVITELTVSLSQVDEESLARAVDLLEKKERIFVTGAGRSGLCMSAFGNRLMHLGKQAHILGERTTPSAHPGDLLVIGSGSGKTKGLVTAAEKAIELDLEILLITTDLNSPLASLAAHKILIPAPSLDQQSERSSIQPMGTLFEQTLLILSDILILRLMKRLNVSVDEMRQRHANLE